MPTTTVNRKSKTKSTTPSINYLLIIFSLPMHESSIHLFRQHILSCIPDEKEREIWSNEIIRKDGKVIQKSCYPLIQYRCHQGNAAIYAIKTGVPLLEKFLNEYCTKKEGRKLFPGIRNGFLNTMNSEKDHNFEIKSFRGAGMSDPIIYRLHTWLPLNQTNYAWWKNNRNEPDTVKTKKLEQLLVNHICTLIHYSGGFIPKKKIKLTILDKDRLKKITYKDEGHVAFDIRYTVNLHLPQYVGLGNAVSHGFGWQRLETN